DLRLVHHLHEQRKVGLGADVTRGVDADHHPHERAVFAIVVRAELVAEGADDIRIALHAGAGGEASRDEGRRDDPPHTWSPAHPALRPRTGSGTAHLIATGPVQVPTTRSYRARARAASSVPETMARPSANSARVTPSNA